MLSEWVSVCWVVIGCSSNLVCPVLRTSYSCHCHGGGVIVRTLWPTVSLSLSLFVNKGIVCFIYLTLERCYYCVMGNQRQATKQSLYSPIDS